MGDWSEGEGSPKSWSLRVSLGPILEQGFGHVASYPGEHSVAQSQAGPMQWLQTVRLGWSSTILAQMAPGTLAHIVYGREGLRSDGCS